MTITTTATTTTASFLEHRPRRNRIAHRATTNTTHAHRRHPNIRRDGRSQGGGIVGDDFLFSLGKDDFVV